ncbi:MAG: hypothetical protein C4320_06255 [Armatimonadota bacterium]
MGARLDAELGGLGETLEVVLRPVGDSARKIAERDESGQPFEVSPVVPKEPRRAGGFDRHLQPSLALTTPTGAPQGALGVKPKSAEEF